MAEEESKTIVKRNWADEDDDAEEDDGVEIGGATVAQVGQKKAEPEASSTA